MNERVVDVLFFGAMLVIIILANLADKRRMAGGFGERFAGFSYGSLIVFYGIIVFLGLTIQDHTLRVWTDQELPQNNAVWALGIWAPAAAAPFFLLPAARKNLARLIPIDYRSSVHAIAIFLVTLPVIMLAFEQALGPGTEADLGEASQTGAAAAVTSILNHRIQLAVWTLVGVGWLTRRTWRQVLERLGLVKPRPNEIAIGIGSGLLLFGILLILESLRAATGWELNGKAAQLQDPEFGLLFRSIPATLTAGIAIGIGDEALFRGALQPKLGLLLTSLLFVVVFCSVGSTLLGVTLTLMIGLTLGVLRMRFNTTTCVTVHCTYNIAYGIIEHFHPQLL